MSTGILDPELVAIRRREKRAATLAGQSSAPPVASVLDFGPSSVLGNAGDVGIDPELAAIAARDHAAAPAVTPPRSPGEYIQAFKDPSRLTEMIEQHALTGGDKEAWRAYFAKHHPEYNPTGMGMIYDTLAHLHSQEALPPSGEGLQALVRYDTASPQERRRLGAAVQISQAAAGTARRQRNERAQAEWRKRDAERAVAQRAEEARARQGRADRKTHLARYGKPSPAGRVDVDVGLTELNVPDDSWLANVAAGPVGRTLGAFPEGGQVAIGARDPSAVYTVPPAGASRTEKAANWLSRMAGALVGTQAIPGVGLGWNALAGKTGATLESGLLRKAAAGSPTAVRAVETLFAHPSAARIIRGGLTQTTPGAVFNVGESVAQSIARGEAPSPVEVAKGAAAGAAGALLFGTATAGLGEARLQLSGPARDLRTAETVGKADLANAWSRFADEGGVPFLRAWRARAGGGMEEVPVSPLMPDTAVHQITLSPEATPAQTAIWELFRQRAIRYGSVLDAAATRGIYLRPGTWGATLQSGVLDAMRQEAGGGGRAALPAPAEAPEVVPSAAEPPLQGADAAEFGPGVTPGASSTGARPGPAVAVEPRSAGLTSEELAGEPVGPAEPSPAVAEVVALGEEYSRPDTTDGRRDEIGQQLDAATRRMSPRQAVGALSNPVLGFTPGEAAERHQRLVHDELRMGRVYRRAPDVVPGWAEAYPDLAAEYPEFVTPPEAPGAALEGGRAGVGRPEGRTPSTQAEGAVVQPGTGAGAPGVTTPDLAQMSVPELVAERDRLGEILRAHARYRAEEREPPPGETERTQRELDGVEQELAARGTRATQHGQDAIGRAIETPAEGAGTPESDALIDDITKAVVKSGRLGNAAIHRGGRRSRATINVARIAAKHGVPEKLVDIAAGVGALSSLENDPDVVRAAVKAAIGASPGAAKPVAPVSIHPAPKPASAPSSADDWAALVDELRNTTHPGEVAARAHFGAALKAGERDGWSPAYKLALRNAKRELDKAIAESRGPNTLADLRGRYASHRWSTFRFGLDDTTREMAEEAVRRATDEGKPVPPEILADYPALAELAPPQHPEVSPSVAAAPATRAPLPRAAPGPKESLPADLSGAKPRYSFGRKQYVLTFESDVDRALYVVAQAKPSKADARYLAWLQQQFPDVLEADLRAAGQRIRNEVIKPQARDGEGGTLRVADTGYGSETRPAAGAPVAPAPKPPVATIREGRDLSATASVIGDSIDVQLKVGRKIAERLSLTRAEWPSDPARQNDLLQQKLGIFQAEPDQVGPRQGQADVVRKAITKALGEEAPPTAPAPIPPDLAENARTERLRKGVSDPRQRRISTLIDAISEIQLPPTPLELRRAVAEKSGLRFVDRADTPDAPLAPEEFNIDDLYDAIEGAMNRAWRTLPPSDLGTLMRVGQELEAQLGRRQRSIEITKLQQFSTPYPVSGAAVYAADVQPGELIYEPTAGTGNLVAPFLSDPQVSVWANELDPRRAAVLRDLGFTDVTQADALGQKRAVDVIVTNPPWGKYSTGRYAGRRVPLPFQPTDLSQRFAAWQIEHQLKDGGRMVAIMPTVEDSAFRQWLGTKGMIRAIIDSPPGAYRARGTDVGSRLYVFDKTPYNDGRPPVLATGDAAPTDWESYQKIVRPLAQGGAVARPERGIIPAGEQADAPSRSLPKATGTTRPAPAGGRRVSDTVAGAEAPRDADTAPHRPAGDVGPDGDRGDTGPGVPPRGPAEGPRRPEGGVGELRPGREGEPVSGVDAGPGSVETEGPEPGGTGDLVREGAGRRTIEQRLRRERSDAAEAADHSDLYAGYTLRGPERDAPHPRLVVESRTLSGVPAPPLSVPVHPLVARAVRAGVFSSEQVDGYLSAMQANDPDLVEGRTYAPEKPAGHAFLLGDDMGLGKSREIGAVALHWQEVGLSRRMVLVTHNQNVVDEVMREMAIVATGNPHAQKGEYPYTIVRCTDVKGAAHGAKTPAALPVSDAPTIYIVDFPNLRRYVDSLTAVAPDALLADEVHEYRNPEAQVGGAWLKLHDAIRGHKSGGRFAYFSGTPAEEPDHLRHLFGWKLWDTRKGSFDEYMARGAGRVKGGGGGKAPADVLATIATGGDASEIESGGQGRQTPTGSYRMSPAEIEQFMRELKARGYFLARSLWRGGVEYETQERTLTPEERRAFEERMALCGDILRAYQQFGAMSKGPQGFGIIAQLQNENKRALADLRLRRAIPDI